MRDRDARRVRATRAVHSPPRVRARGREVTPLAVLSRSVAGTRGRVLIVNLPGSPKGAVESLDAIVELVPHVLELLRGRTEHTPARQD